MASQKVKLPAFFHISSITVQFRTLVLLNTSLSCVPSPLPPSGQKMAITADQSGGAFYENIPVKSTL